MRGLKAWVGAALKLFTTKHKYLLSNFLYRRQYSRATIGVVHLEIHLIFREIDVGRICLPPKNAGYTMVNGKFCILLQQVVSVTHSAHVGTHLCGGLMGMRVCKVVNVCV